MNIQIDLVLTQILGFVLFVWILRKLMWGPVMDMLDQRRHKIAADFRETEKRQADADALAVMYANWRMASVGRARLIWFRQRAGDHARCNLNRPGVAGR